MFPETTVTGKGQNLKVVHGDDSGLWVEFYFNKVYDKNFIKIRVPGDNKTEWNRPVKEQDKARFHRHWEAFNQQRSQFGTQTMIENWEALNEDQIRNLKSFNVQTVEQLANLTDGLITKMGPGVRDLTRKAHAWIESSASEAKEEALRIELKKRDDRLAVQEQQMAQMQEQIQQLLSASPEAKPKRPYTRKSKE